MNAEVRALLVKALRSGDYPECKGRLASGVVRDADGAATPAGWEAGGVLCDLAVKAGVIVPPTMVALGDRLTWLYDEVTWLYRGRETDPPSCISIPRPVMDWAEMELAIGDGFMVHGVWRTWAGHADHGVTHSEFADALEAEASRKREREAA